MSYLSNVKTEFSFTWMIENFSSCYQKEKQYIESPHFPIENMGEMKWCMWLYPRGDRSEERYISVYFGKATEKEIETTVSSYRIRIVGPEGEILASNKADNRVFSSKLWGTEFIKFDEVTRKLKNWTKDTLTIICTVEIREPIKKIASGCTARTKVGVDRCSFRWNVKHPDSPDWCASKKFPFPGDNNLEITMKAPRDKISIRIRRETEQSSVFINCEVHLLDVKGIKIDSRSSQHLLSADTSEDSWELPSFITKSQLDKDSESLLKDGFFTLVFEFSVSNGVESNVIESYKYEPMSVDEDSSVNFIFDLQDDLRRLFYNRELADVSFKIRGEEVKAHKSILAARSPVLSGMLKHVDGSIEIIDVPDLNTKVWDSFLEFLYTGTVNSNIIDYEIASKLLVIADKYQVPSLKEKCTSFLMSILSDSNVSDVLILANKCGSDVLETNALDYIRINAATILPGLDWTKWNN